MPSSPTHSFDVSLEEAKRIQNELKACVQLTGVFASFEEVGLVGGADVAFLEFPSSGTLALAAAVVMEAGTCCVVETSYATAPVLFPYIPGFLTFREGPAVLAAMAALSALPDVMIYDGAGIAHPRGLGIASHMALLTGIPSIGCAKSLLMGSCEEPGMEKGDRSFLYYHECIIGVCLRTRRGVKPVYVSPGSGFSVDGACSFVLSLTGKCRLPEPARIAHNLVTAKKRELTRKGGEIVGMRWARGV